MRDFISFTFLRAFFLQALLFVPLPRASQGIDMTSQELRMKDIERALFYEKLSNSEAGGPGLPTPRWVSFEDADDDGMPDSWESANGLDPNDPDDAWFDPDSDEVVNLFEYQLGGALDDPALPPVATVAPSGADFTEVETAIDSVEPGTVIRVAGGSYPVTYMTFTTRIVMIQGGWSSDFSQRDLGQYPTTFEGGMQDEILYFSIDSGDPVIVLDGINFIAGKGCFGAVNLLARGNASMKTSIFNCSIKESMSDTCVNPPPFGGVLSLNNWDSSQSDRTIANTVIGGNQGSGIYSQITDTTKAHWRIVNTTISHNLNNGDNGFGIRAFTLESGELSAHIYNSIVWGNDQADLNISRNITFQVDHSDIGNVDTSGGAIYAPGSGVLEVDPLFVDSVSNDFHLQGSSPVIDTGINQGIPLIDFEGDPRIFGTKVDMGADEYQGLAVTEPRPIRTNSSSAPFVLENVPNPFNSKTMILYRTPLQGVVGLDIHSASGQHVVSLVNSRQSPGYHNIMWRPIELPSGIYFCVLKVGDVQVVRQMLLLK